MASGAKRMSLVVPREQALAMVEEALARGEGVLADAESVHDDDSFKQWGAEALNWRRFAQTTMHAISDDDRLEQELVRVTSGPRVGTVGGPPPSVAERLERRRNTLVAEINLVRSVIERIPLL